MAKIVLDTNFDEVHNNITSVDEVWSNGIQVWAKASTPPEPGDFPPFPSYSYTPSNYILVWYDFARMGGAIPDGAQLTDKSWCYSTLMPELVPYMVNVTPIAADEILNTCYDLKADADEFGLPTDENGMISEFVDFYDTANTETNSSRKLALTALAEAKLIETGTIMPFTVNSNCYAMSRLFDQTNLVLNELIPYEARQRMTAIYNQYVGTGEAYSRVREAFISEGFSEKDNLKLYYTQDEFSSNYGWDIQRCRHINTWRILRQLTLPLLRKDVEGILQPCAAESYEILQDTDGALTGLRFNIRQGVIWTDSQGRKVGDFQADDFVAGVQHALDCGNTEGLIGVIKNAQAYVDGEVTDFTQVGVTASSSFILDIEFEEPQIGLDLNSLLELPTWQPLCRLYYEAKGGGFGTDFDDSPDSSYEYGKTSVDICYAGAYFVNVYTEKSTIILRINISYYDVDNLNIETITYVYFDYKVPDRAYEDLKDGNVDFALLTVRDLVNVYNEQNAGNVYFYGYGEVGTFLRFNLPRHEEGVFEENVNSDDTYVRAATCLKYSENLRRFLVWCLDRQEMHAQFTGMDTPGLGKSTELGRASLANIISQSGMGDLTEETSIEINGSVTTFDTGTPYAEIIGAQLAADGFGAGDGSPGTSLSFDGWRLDDTTLTNLFNVVVEELFTLGTEVTADHPLIISLWLESETTQPIADNVLFYNMANELKNRVNAASGNRILIEFEFATSMENYIELFGHRPILEFVFARKLKQLRLF